MFREYVQNIAMVMIFTSFLGLILPRSKHKSYIRLIAGLVVVLAIISPVVRVFNNQNLDEIFVSFERQLGLDVAARSLRHGTPFEDAMLRAVLEEHRMGLEASIRLKVSSLGYELEDARIYIDESEENFGMIAGLFLTLSRETAEPNRGLIRVDRVSVSNIGIGQNAPSAQDNYSEEINTIKKLLSDFYNLSVENIDIIVTD